jgi:GNAT superfamily N-acetyltransferase
MAPSDTRAAPIDVLGEDDLAEALALSEEAGWNQVAADWLLMLRLGSGFAVRDSGRVVATAVTLPYPPVFGWVSMVLVHTPYRRLGLATRLVERATAALTDAGLLPVLDATPAGAEVYGRMGFRPVGQLLRWRGTGGAGVGASQVEPAIGDPVRELDGAAFGADRGAILADLSGRPAPVAALAEGGDGYLLSRAGRTATQLGPLIARDATTATALLAEGLDAVAGAVVVDVPEHATVVAAHLAGRGFAPERPFVRLALGRDEIAGTPALVHAIAGPELG